MQGERKIEEREYEEQNKYSGDSKMIMVLQAKRGIVNFQ